MIARELGYTRHELLQRLTSREVTEWAAYLGLENEPPQQSAEDMKGILKGYKSG